MQIVVKNKDHKVHLIAVLQHSVLSHDLHQQMEVVTELYMFSEHFTGFSLPFLPDDEDYVI